MHCMESVQIVQELGWGFCAYWWHACPLQPAKVKIVFERASKALCSSYGNPACCKGKVGTPDGHLPTQVMLGFLRRLSTVVAHNFAPEVLPRRSVNPKSCNSKSLSLKSHAPNLNGA